MWRQATDPNSEEDIPDCEVREVRLSIVVKRSKTAPNGGEDIPDCEMAEVIPSIESAVLDEEIDELPRAVQDNQDEVEVLAEVTM